ncbi:MAG: glycosyltransferase [Candidatus Methanomethylicia archaeon]|nr:glycosyltransferase [Candidatus Methanomethylicia archaeon]
MKKTAAVSNNTSDRIRNMKVVVGIPALNEERTIATVILKAKPHCDQIIVCDDGSSDMTAAISEALGATVIKHPYNKGYGAALDSIFSQARAAKADILVTLDGDNQHDPASIPALIAPIMDDSADIVIGSRFLGNNNIPNHRKVGIKIINDVTNSTGDHDTTDTQSGFRAYGRKAIESIKITEMGMSASTEILLKANSNKLRLKEVPVEIKYETRPSPTGSVKQGSSVLLNTLKLISIDRPLVFYGIPSMIFLGIGLVFGAWSAISYATDGVLPASLALIAIGSTLLGFLFFSLMMMIWVVVSVARDKLGN